MWSDLRYRVYARRLVPTLCIILVASALLHQRWPMAGFWVNVAAGVVGIFITVIFVDQVVREANETAWRSADRRIGSRLRLVATGSATGVGRILGWELPGGLNFGRGMTDIGRAQVVAINSVVSMVEPNILDRLKALDADGWRRLNDQCRRAQDDADRAFGLFGHRLRPTQLDALICISDGARQIEQRYDVWPQLFQSTSQVSALDDPTGDVMAARDVNIGAVSTDLRSMLTNCRTVAASTLAP